VVLKAFSTIAAGLAVFLASWLLFQTRANNRWQLALEDKQDRIQALQASIQQGSVNLQAQQQQLDTARQLSEQVGPAILRDLAELGSKNSNIALAVFLQKHGVEFRPNAE
jgi:hypothetical protein